jgi:predicted metal-binding membrane protein
MSAAPSNSLRPGPSVQSFPVPERTVYVSALVVFAVAAGTTLYLTHSRSGGMLMPGNRTMSMMRMVMPNQTWLGALSFVGMWLAAMMVAMMLPSSLPMLLLYRRAALFRGEARLGWRTFVVGVGYFFIWVQFGVLAYLLGEAVTRASMASVAVCRVIPFADSAALVLAGIFQVSPWKSACLRHCLDPLSVVAHPLHGGWRGALGLGIHHGAAECCWALMLIQLVLGVMNLTVMVTVGVVIALEKLISPGELVARITGVVSILGGITLAASSVMGWHFRI